MLVVSDQKLDHFEDLRMGSGRVNGQQRPLLTRPSLVDSSVEVIIFCPRSRLHPSPVDYPLRVSTSCDRQIVCEELFTP